MNSAGFIRWFRDPGALLEVNGKSLNLPVGVGLEAICGSGCKIHPRVSMESEPVTRDLDISPVWGDHPDLAISLNLDIFS